MDVRGQATTALVASLHWIYDRLASNKGPPPAEGDIEGQIAALIRAASAQAGLVGFATGLGGLITLPIALPANIAGVLTLQINLIQEIARLRGHPLDSERVRTLTLACLAGNTAFDVLKTAGVRVGERLTLQAIAQLSGPTLARIAELVGVRLAATAGASGSVNLAKAVPVVGGLVGGAMDGLLTAAVGAAARAMFPAAEPQGTTTAEPPA